ncbi:MAG TPA: hypothetical protein VIM11_02420, partial [Tepidisphaeraceae bacterium]
LRTSLLLPSLTAAISTFFTIVLWPWGFIPVAYLTIRLHLNKIIALIFILLCMPTPIAHLSARLGHSILHADSHPHLERFIGSHILAFPAALFAGWLVYATARRIRPESKR